jgi:hypothetical protein
MVTPSAVLVWVVIAVAGAQLRKKSSSAEFTWPAWVQGMARGPPSITMSFTGQFYLAGHGLCWTVNPSFPSTATAPLFPPSKSPESRRWPVANS